MKSKKIIVGKTKTALIIDDSDFHYQSIEGLLKPFFFVSTHAKDGQEALHIITQHKIPYDVIFLDINMPVMNGFEFLKSYNGSSPIIMISTDIKASEKAVAQYGAWGWIHKPPIKTELQSILRSLELIY